jgi:hypothetical protein
MLFLLSGAWGQTVHIETECNNRLSQHGRSSYLVCCWLMQFRKHNCMFCTWKWGDCFCTRFRKSPQHAWYTRALHCSKLNGSYYINAPYTKTSVSIMFVLICHDVPQLAIRCKLTCFSSSCLVTRINDMSRSFNRYSFHLRLHLKLHSHRYQDLVEVGFVSRTFIVLAHVSRICTAHYKNLLCRQILSAFFRQYYSGMAVSPSVGY